jgi:DNA replication protein DnaC
MRLIKSFEDMSPADWAAHDRQVQATTAREARVAATARRRKRIAEMEIPERALEIAGGELLDTDARRLIQGDAVITVLSGNVGVGKSVAACEWLLQHEKGLFVKAASLARVDRSHVPRLLHTPALVLDDVGAEYLDHRGHLLALLDELIDHRYDGRLPTVITTNLDEHVFRMRYGERIIDRIRELGRFVVIGGVSMRKRP